MTRFNSRQLLTLQLFRPTELSPHLAYCSIRSTGLGRPMDHVSDTWHEALGDIYHRQAPKLRVDLSNNQLEGPRKKSTRLKSFDQSFLTDIFYHWEGVAPELRVDLSNNQLEGPRKRNPPTNIIRLNPPTKIFRLNFLRLKSSD